MNDKLIRPIKLTYEFLPIHQNTDKYKVVKVEHIDK